MTAEQSPQTSGSFTGRAQVGHQSGCAGFVSVSGDEVAIPISSLAKIQPVALRRAGMCRSFREGVSIFVRVETCFAFFLSAGIFTNQ
jgi:hypothetical protein